MKSQSRRYRVTVLGKLFTPIMPLFCQEPGLAPATHTLGNRVWATFTWGLRLHWGHSLQTPFTPSPPLVRSGSATAVSTCPIYCTHGTVCVTSDDDVTSVAGCKCFSVCMNRPAGAPRCVLRWRAYSLIVTAQFCAVCSLPRALVPCAAAAVVDRGSA